VVRSSAHFSLLHDSEDILTAGHAYAIEHDSYSNRLHTFNQWFVSFISRRLGCRCRRARAFPLIGEDPSRQPDSLFAKPDMPADADTKKRFFAEV